MSDPRAQLREMIRQKLLQACPGCVGLEVRGERGNHLRLSEVEYLAESLMELFSTVGVSRHFPTHGNPGVDTRPFLTASTEYGTADLEALRSRSDGR